MTDPEPAPRVLVYVDESKDSDYTVAFAGLLARALGADVALLATGKLDRRRQLLFELSERLLDLPSGSKVERIAEPGLVERVLPAAAEKGGFDLTVVGKLGSLDWLSHGPVLTHVLRKVPGSLLVVKRHTMKIERVLVCTSGQHCEPVVKAGLALGRAAKARVTVLHVLSHMRVETARFHEERELAEELLKLEFELRAHLDDCRAWAREIGAEAEVKVRTGAVEEEILAESREGGHDLAVFGPHRPGRDSFLLRDMADWLVHHVRIPSMVVRGRLPEKIAAR